MHVNYTPRKPRYGILLCVNGTGILNSWIKHTLDPGNSMSYNQLDEYAATVPVGSEGLSVIPFGNGAERTLGNRDTGASVQGLQFNRHTRAHLLRAAQEGIVFALAHGFEIMRAMGVKTQTVRAGKANMFLSPLFCEAFAASTGTTVELFNTDGSQGAARGAGVGCGIYKNFNEAFTGLSAVKTIRPDKKLRAGYSEAYDRWTNALQRVLAKQ